MIKSALAALAALPILSSAALAGPYVNLETNSGFVGNEYVGSLTETHVGYEGPVGENAAWYIQGGPAISTPDGGDTTTEASGKVGMGIDVTEKMNVYGEVWAMTAGEFDLDEDLSFNTKVGVKYSF